MLNTVKLLLAHLVRAALVLLPLAAAAQPARPSSYTYPELVERMYDLQYLAIPPAPGEKSGNFTSYDRRSRYDTATGTYVDWDANGDGEGFIREENGGQVVFEKDGPGCIWRIWSALAKEGHVKIYLDHAATPVIDRPFRALFENFDEGVPPMNLPSFVNTLSRGRNRFLPLPYNQHCKIVLEKNWGAYYQITYSTMPAGTVLPQFTGVYSKADGFKLAAADRFLHDRGLVRKHYPQEQVTEVRVGAKAAGRTALTTLSGNRAISHFTVQLDDSYATDAAKRQDLLKNVWLSIQWDGDAQPAVLVPLGLFFGAAPDVQPYRAYPIGSVDGQSFYSNWYMPFAEKATIAVVNKGQQRHTFTWRLAHAPAPSSAKELLRFHAKWNNGQGFEAIKAQGRAIDWPLLITKGTGRFCGVTLHVLNTWEEPAETAATWWYGQWDKKTIDWWWGEGDEKFFVDGEKFPSTFGTGSEDYIGYAWSAEPPFALFDSPFATQPQTPLNGNGHTLVSRFQLADNVPFFTSFEGVLEKYKPNRWGDKRQNVCEFESVSYWYLKPGQADTYH